MGFFAMCDTLSQCVTQSDPLEGRKVAYVNIFVRITLAPHIPRPRPICYRFPGFTRVIASESVAIDHTKFYICLYETASESAKHLLHSYVYMSDMCVTIYDVCR